MLVPGSVFTRNNAAHDNTFDFVVPPAVLPGHVVQFGCAYGSGSRTATALVNGQPVAELAPKVSFSGFGMHLFSWTAKPDTAGGKTLTLTIDGAALRIAALGFADDELTSALPSVQDSDPFPSTASTVKTAPAVPARVAGTVEYSWVADSENGVAPLAGSTSWQTPAGLTVVGQDVTAPLSTGAPLPSIAAARRPGLVAPPDSLGGRAWSATRADGTVNDAAGAAWTAGFSTVAPMADFYLLTADGFVPLTADVV